MLMIQGKEIRIVNRAIKEKDQIALMQDDEIKFKGCVDMVIVTPDRITYIMHTASELIHIVVERKSSTGQIFLNYITITIYRPEGITYHTGDEYKIVRMFNPSKNYEAFIGEELKLETSEQVSVKVERPLTIEDKLKYVNDGRTYDILYISPHGNMIIKEPVSGEERVVNKKDRQLQIALGIRNT